MNGRVDNVLAKYYDIKINKYVAWCRIKVDGDWMYKMLFFTEVEEWKKLTEGSVVDV